MAGWGLEVVMLTTCKRCKCSFHRAESEGWKRLCLECWVATKRHREEGSADHLQAELSSWRARALSAERSLAERQSGPSIDLQMLKRIRMLVHPDKHGGSRAATEVSQAVGELILKASISDQLT